MFCWLALQKLMLSWVAVSRSGKVTAVSRIPAGPQVPQHSHIVMTVASLLSYSPLLLQNAS